MTVQTCVGCSTQYADGLDACPHCGSTDYTKDGAVMSSRRLPLLVSVSCECGCGPWQLRLPMVLTGLVQIPALHCASCGRQVQIPWPPVEDAMPKITTHGGPTNARTVDPSPDTDASSPLVGAEADQGHPTAADADTTPAQEPSGQPQPSADTDAATVAQYDSMTLAELRELATKRNLPSYGTKAQLAERLREADEAPAGE